LSVKTLTAKILLYLRDYPGVGVKDISESFNISLTTARSILYRLKNLGYIEKAGNGYILTSRGEKLVEAIMKKSVKDKSTVETVRKDTSTRSEVEVVKSVEASQVSKPGVDSLEDRVKKLEVEVNELKAIVNQLRMEVESIKDMITSKTRREERSEGEYVLPKPVMNYKEAYEQLGSKLEQLRIEGKILIIGSIIVDRKIYDEFVKKFPIPVEEESKLSPYEQMLLQEMKKEAYVILHAGREYRLVVKR